jgi:hypothetical protein
MDETLMMHAAALVCAAEEGFVVPEGAMPAVAFDDEGNATVSAGEASLLVASDEVLECAIALEEMLGADEAEMPAEEAPVEEPAPEAAE